MHTNFRRQALALALVLFCLCAQAASLTPYQQQALNKILATMPAEHREMARPQIEATIARLDKAQIDMMLAQMAGKQNEAAQSTPDRSEGEWGKAEADFARVFPQVQAYIARIADVRDRAAARWERILKDLGDDFLRQRANSFVDRSAVEACNKEMNLVPQGRAKSGAVAEAVGEQDRILFRILVENRARYGTLDKYAQALGQPVSAPLVQAVAHHFAAPMAEGDVMARLAMVETQIAGLAESSSKELHRIYITAYPDQGAGISSKLQAKDLEAHRSKTTQMAATICAQGAEAYQRGLVQFGAPLVPKVKPYLQ